jgi:hypothetical protein
MCGPPDFDALRTCVSHLAELSVAGLTGYSVHKALSLCHRFGPKHRDQAEKPLREAPGQLAVEGAGGRDNP